MEAEILTVDDISSYLKIAKKTVYKLAVDRKIPAFKVVKAWRFKKADIDLWIESNQRKINDTK